MSELEMRVHRVVAPVRQQVYEQLRNAIISSRFAAGKRLVERELAQMTGVSRPTVREALQQLSAEGLVSNVPARGWIVASLTREEAEDLYATRGVLEGLAVRRFVERAKDEDVVALQDAFAKMKTALTPGHDVEEMLEAKDRFYNALFTGARSDIIVSLVESLHARIGLMRARSLSQEGRWKETLQEIGDIVDAIVARDAIAAEHASISHIEKAADTVFAGLTDSDLGVSGDGR